VNSLPETVTRQCCSCDLNLGLSARESSTLTTCLVRNSLLIVIIPAKAFARDYAITGVRLSVCLSVTTILNKTWTDLDEIFWEGS